MRRIYVAFAIEDKTRRDLLTNQNIDTAKPFEFFADAKVMTHDESWKNRVRTGIKNSDGVLALISKNSLNSLEQNWEIACAKIERKPIRGIYAYPDDKTSFNGVTTLDWSGANISGFIDSF